MESSAELVPFPLLLTPIESNYRACTIPYRFPSDNPRKATPTEISWIDLFRNSIPSFRFLSRFRPDFLFPCRLVFGHGCHRLKPTLSWKHDNCSAFLYYLTAVYTDEAWCFKNAPSFSLKLKKQQIYGSFLLTKYYLVMLLSRTPNSSLHFSVPYDNNFTKHNYVAVLSCLAFE